ncbi:MAG TPA: DUF423 domain-containing protein [Gemmatimonadota bacterium]|nr:DUF423 domain-containing protein [Gemmatimonadota bacterium]
MANRWLETGAVLAGLGVAAGAFGTHALSGRLSPDLLDVFETATRYHLLHAVALLVVGLAAARNAGTRLWNAAGWLFTAGILVFGGSLYALALTGARWLGAVTPIGGACFLAGWAVVAVAAARSG